MLYFDSSYLFRIYSTEPGHLAVKALLAQANQPVAVAWHGRAEIASILLPAAFRIARRECDSGGVTAGIPKIR